MSEKNQRRYKSPLNLVKISRCSSHNMHARTIAANMSAKGNETVTFYFVSFARVSLSRRYYAQFFHSFTTNWCAPCVFLCNQLITHHWATISCGCFLSCSVVIIYQSLSRTLLPKRCKSGQLLEFLPFINMQSNCLIELKIVLLQFRSVTVCTVVEPF